MTSKGLTKVQLSTGLIKLNYCLFFRNFAAIRMIIEGINMFVIYYSMSGRM